MPHVNTITENSDKTPADHLQTLERVVTTSRYHSLGEAQEALASFKWLSELVFWLEQRLEAAYERVAAQSELLSKKAEKP